MIEWIIWVEGWGGRRQLFFQGEEEEAMGMSWGARCRWIWQPRNRRWSFWGILLLRLSRKEGTMGSTGMKGRGARIPIRIILKATRVDRQWNHIPTTLNLTDWWEKKSRSETRKTNGYLKKSSQWTPRANNPCPTLLPPSISSLSPNSSPPTSQMTKRTSKAKIWSTVFT